MTAATEPITICVYCGSRHGDKAAYADDARSLGKAIGSRGWQLIYGGGRVGLMGEIADAVLGNGGRVVGVIPESLKQREVEHRGLHELHVVPTMHIRKQMMAERATVFIALPGGIGTLEELYEVWTWRQLGYHQQPIGLLNTAGYYDDLLRFMRKSVTDGFLSADQLNAVQVDVDAERLLLRLVEAAQSHLAADSPIPDLSKT